MNTNQNKVRSLILSSLGVVCFWLLKALYKSSPGDPRLYSELVVFLVKLQSIVGETTVDL